MRRSTRLRGEVIEEPVINVEDDNYEEEELVSDSNMISDSENEAPIINTNTISENINESENEAVYDDYSNEDYSSEDQEYSEAEDINKKLMKRKILQNYNDNIDKSLLERLEQEYCIHDACEVGDTNFLHIILQDEYSNIRIPNEYLLQDLNIHDIDGLTPIQVCIAYNQLSCLELLLKCPLININCKVSGIPLLHFVLQKGSHTINHKFIDNSISLILKYNINCNDIDDMNRTCLHIASQYDLLSSMIMILNNPLCNCIHHQDIEGNTILHISIKYSSLQCIIYILQNYPELLFIKDNYDNTPIRYLSYLNKSTYTKIVNILDNILKDEKYDTLYKEYLCIIETINTKTVTNNTKNYFTIYRDDEVILHITTKEYPTRRSIGIPNENIQRIELLLNKFDGLLNSDILCKNTEQYKIITTQRIADSIDILRVHEYSYIYNLIETVSNINTTSLPTTILDKFSRVIPNSDTFKTDLKAIDVDTVVSPSSYRAALRGAGMVLDAVDSIANNNTRIAFCALRPPGHHVGPSGAVNPDDEGSSLGFCLFNNVAIGSAYARCIHRNIFERIAILDFDVHHGNGTESIIRNLIPNININNVNTPYGKNTYTRPCYKPWLNNLDTLSVFFVSIHGKSKPNDLWFYPGSGDTTYGIDSSLLCGDGIKTTYNPNIWKTIFHYDDTVTDTQYDSDILSYKNQKHQNVLDILSNRQDSNIEEEKKVVYNHSFDIECIPKQMKQPRILNIAMNLGNQLLNRIRWRRAWRQVVLPSLLKHNPDIIFISAGFDAHFRDKVSYSYGCLIEYDYIWVTEQIIRVANTVCQGRILSILEGGYNLNGRYASPLVQSVNAHITTLQRPLYDTWDEQLSINEQLIEDRLELKVCQMANSSISSSISTESKSPIISSDVTFDAKRPKIM